MAAAMSTSAPTLHHVPFGRLEIAVHDYSPKVITDAPTVVLLHGFPDNASLYELLVAPLLAAGRRVVTPDFIGWGRSSKPSPASYSYSHDAWTRELAAVVNHLGLTSLVLVVHDASGPTGIDFAVADVQRPPGQRVVKGLLLLNSYYNWASAFRKPEAIWLFSTPATRPVAAWVNKSLPAVRRAIFRWQVGRFFVTPAVRHRFVERFLADFPSEFDAFVALNAELNGALTQRSTPAHTQAAAAMAAQLPVAVLFGDGDPYLSPAVAHNMQALLPAASLELVSGARHYPQLDTPDVVAAAILRLGS